MEDAADKLKDGAVGVIPTDTTYGIVAQAANKVAVERLYKLKQRQHKPGTIVAASVDQLVELGLKRRYLKAVEDYWPGPLSVIIPCGPELSYLHQGVNGLAVRLPSDKPLTTLLKLTGPLLTTSANPSSQPTATTIDQAKQYFGDKLDFYIDGGDLSNHLASTIVRIVDDAVEVLRQGAAKVN